MRREREDLQCTATQSAADQTLQRYNTTQHSTAHSSLSADSVVQTHPHDTTCKAHTAALISISSALSQTPVYTARPWIRARCITQCARSTYRWYSLRLPWWDGQAELTWVAGYIMRWFTCRQTVTITQPTGPSIE